MVRVDLFWPTSSFQPMDGNPLAIVPAVLFGDAGLELVVNLGKVSISDVTKLMLCEIGDTDDSHIAFNLYPLVVLAVTEAFYYFAHD